MPQPRRLQGSSLPAPSDREKTQIYTQRYLQHFLAAGEVVICDLSSYTRAGIEYVRTRDLMLKRTDTRIAPWYLVRPDDKRTARLNTPAHVLPLVPYKMLPQKKLKPPGRSRKGACDDEASIARRRFVRDQY